MARPVRWDSIERPPVRHKRPGPRSCRHFIPHHASGHTHSQSHGAHYSSAEMARSVRWDSNERPTVRKQRPGPRSSRHFISHHTSSHTPPTPGVTLEPSLHSAPHVQPHASNVRSHARAVTSYRTTRPATRLQRPEPCSSHHFI